MMKEIVFKCFVFYSISILNNFQLNAQSLKESLRINSIKVIDSVIQSELKGHSVNYKFDWDSTFTINEKTGSLGITSARIINDNIYNSKSFCFVPNFSQSDIDSVMYFQKNRPKINNPNYNTTVVWIRNPIEGWDFPSLSRIENGFIHFPVCVCESTTDSYIEPIWYVFTFKFLKTTNSLLFSSKQKL